MRNLFRESHQLLPCGINSALQFVGPKGKFAGPNGKSVGPEEKSVGPEEKFVGPKGNFLSGKSVKPSENLGVITWGFHRIPIVARPTAETPHVLIHGLDRLRPLAELPRAGLRQ